MNRPRLSLVLPLVPCARHLVLVPAVRVLESSPSPEIGEVTEPRPVLGLLSVVHLDGGLVGRADRCTAGLSRGPEW
jgi:hypothetical protein